jgi:hypothetical protein
MRPEGLCHSNDTIGNRTRDLPACSAVPEVTAQLRARPMNKGPVAIFLPLSHVVLCPNA